MHKGGFRGAKRHGQTADQETRECMGECMGDLKGRSRPVPCLGETTQDVDMCTHQAASAVTLLEAMQCIYDSGC
eukprot:164459-Pelagomonas_calceolata.AAC.2